MLQKMYTFIIQRGYMGSLIMLTGLAIMSFMDIKRRAVPVYMIIVMSILAIGIKIAGYIFGYKKVDVYEMFIILPRLTIVTQPTEEIGQAAANLLLSHLEDKDETSDKTSDKIETTETIWLKTGFVEGESVADIS